MSTQQTGLNRILEIIGKIAKITADGDYIYRGEQECYKKVSSNLWRELNKLNLLDLDVEEVQKRELEDAKKYSNETDEFEILIEIQHFGGKTNLIDFTTHPYVALFFACNGSPDKDGRIILQSKTEKIKDWIRELPNPDTTSRPGMQKSIFVQPPEGFTPNDFIKPDETIVIPKDLKHPILEYIKKEFHISTETIYHDLHGFIGSQDSRWNSYSELKQGEKSQDSGGKTEHPKEKTEHYLKASEHFTNALNLMPASAELYYNRGLVYHQLGEIDLAIQDYNLAINLQPGFVEAYDNRGLAYEEKGKFDFAIQDYDMGIKMNPNRSEIFNNRGTAYGSKEDYDRAIEDCTEAIALNPDAIDAYYNRGNAYLHKNELDSAIEDYNNAIKLNQSDAAAYCNRGLAYSGKSEFDLAIESYNKAIDLDPNEAGFYNSRGVAYNQRSEFDLAIEDFNKAIKLNSDEAGVYYNRGMSYYTKGEIDRAIEDYNKAIVLPSEIRATL